MSMNHYLYCVIIIKIGCVSWHFYILSYLYYFISYHVYMQYLVQK